MKRLRPLTIFQKAYYGICKLLNYFHRARFIKVLVDTYGINQDGNKKCENNAYGCD